MEVRLVTMTVVPEHVIANAARHVYGHVEPVGNPEKISGLIRKLIKLGHESPIEHASATIEFKDVSRVMTHQLVRHRLCSFTQKSGRYTKASDNEKGFPFQIPYSIATGTTDELLAEYIMKASSLYDFYHKLLINGIKKEDARYILPAAHFSNIILTANLREWRHIFKIRGEKHAQWEIRVAVCKAFDLLKAKAPNVFCDMKHNKERKVIEIDDSDIKD